MAGYSKYSRGPGDSILALLEPGEYVLNRNAVDEVGRKNLDELNYEDAPRFDMSKRGQFQAGGMLGDMIGYQEGSEVVSDATRTSQMEDIFLSQKRPLRMTPLWEQIIRTVTGTTKPMTPDEKTDRYFRDRGPVLMDEEQPIFVDPKDVKDLYSMQRRDDRYDKYNTRDYFMNRGARAYDIDELLKMRNKGESVQDALMGKQIGGILGMQAGGSTLEYGGATTETQTLDDIYRQAGMQPNYTRRPGFEEKWAYDPSREGVIFEDYARAMTGATQKGRQNLMGAGQQMRQSQAKAGFAGAGGAQQSQQQARGNIMQDFLAQEGAAKSSLFKGVRAEREQWAADVTGALGTLEGQGGTSGYGTTATTPDYGYGGTAEQTGLQNFNTLPTSFMGEKISVGENNTVYTWDDTTNSYQTGYK